MSSISEKELQELRECPDHIREQHKQLKAKFADGLIDSVPHVAFVVNSEREVVLYNKAMASLLVDSLKGIALGKRPGELLNCGNTLNHRCGESNSCAQCGAMISLIEALGGGVGNEECNLLTESNGMVNSFIFKVTAAPLEIDGQIFVIVYLTDISDRKNKEVVEKIFLHDLMNAVNGIMNAGSLLREEAIKDTTKELAAMVIDRAMFMANEINAHRLFVSAESNQLEISPEQFSAAEIVESVCAFFSGSQLVSDKNITLTITAEDFNLITDKRIVYRILENLIKNALEASPGDGTVTVEAVREDEFALFTVNNEGTIPITIAHQIFKRSFSTKGKGRGLGTYSVKMFTENYLNGRAWFDSSPDEGTNFYVKLPLELHLDR